MKDSIFYKEIGKKGGLIRQKNMIDEYNKNPNYCKWCNVKIEIKDGETPSVTRQRHFCSKECRSKYQSETMKGNSFRKKDKEIYCLNCDKELNSRQSKYCSRECQKEYEYKEYIKRWKLGLEDGMRGSYQLSSYIMDYIKQKYDYKCCKCGWNKINPTTEKSPLEVHHKDGDYTNNNEDNLELLCPNCHSLTDTYKNILNHNGRQGRKKYYNNVV